MEDLFCLHHHEQEDTDACPVCGRGTAPDTVILWPRTQAREAPLAIDALRASWEPARVHANPAMNPLAVDALQELLDRS